MVVFDEYNITTPHAQHEQGKVIGVRDILYIYTVLPALRANSCIAIDRLMIELLDFHIPFLSFTNAGFKGYGKNLLNRRLRITLLP